MTDATASPPRWRLDTRPRLRLSLLMVVVALAGVAAWAWRFRDENGDVGRSFLNMQIRDLRDGDARARWTAAESLGYGSVDEMQAALAALVNAANDKGPTVRRAVVKSLGSRIQVSGTNKKGQLGPEIEAVLPTLLAALSDRDSGLRAEAAKALGELKGEAQTKRGTAVLTIPFGPDPTRVVPPLEKAARDPDPAVRAGAIRSLGKVAPREGDAPAVLMMALKGDPDEKVREEAAQAIAQPWKNAPALWGPLLGMTSGSDDHIEGVIVWHLPNLGTPPASALPKLLKVLEAETYSARQRGPALVASLGPAARPALPRLLAIFEGQLANGDDLTAAEAIAAIDPSSQEARSILILLAKAARSNPRWPTKQADNLLARLGPPDPAALPDLIAALESRHVMAGPWAARALVALDAKSGGVVAPVAARARELMGRPGRDAWQYHVITLHLIAPSDPEVATLVLPLLRLTASAGEGGEQRARTSYLRRLAPHQIPAIRAALDDPDPKARVLAADLLKLYGRDEAEALAPDRPPGTRNAPPAHGAAPDKHRD